MLLSEALAARAEANERITDLTKRLELLARIQEGDTPAEDPQALLHELDTLLETVEQLVRDINATNAATPFADATLTDALAKREHFLAKRRLYSKLADQASARHDRYSSNELRYVSPFDVKELRRKADEYSKRFRELDTRIQQLNWTTELVKSAQK